MQIAGEAGRRLSVVLAKRRVGVDGHAIALADDQLDMRDVQRGMKFGALRPLDAVVGPQRLHTVVDVDGLERLPARMGAGCTKSRASRLTAGIISSPPGTASAPPGQKSICGSTTIRTSRSAAEPFMQLAPAQVQSRHHS